MTTLYRTQDQQWDFEFSFVPEDDHIAIYCLWHPPLDDVDDDPHYTHLFDSGKLCFIPGREPRTLERAKELAAMWAEYLLRYIETGTPEY